MSPHFLANNYVLAIRHRWQKYKVNDVIIVNHSYYGKMIKRIATIDTKSKNITFTLIGDNPQSVTSEQMGIIEQSQIIGKVIWQIKAKD